MAADRREQQSVMSMGGDGRGGGPPKDHNFRDRESCVGACPCRPSGWRWGLSRWTMAEKGRFSFTHSSPMRVCACDLQRAGRAGGLARPSLGLARLSLPLPWLDLSGSLIFFAPCKGGDRIMDGGSASVVVIETPSGEPVRLSRAGRRAAACLARAAGPG